MRTVKRPNVLLIYTDQQRLDSIGCIDGSIAITPNLDKLASKGALLTNYFVQNPVCTPSRMSFLTGKYCSALGIGINGFPFPEEEQSINMLLSPYGYHTAQIGKLHFMPHAKRDHRDPHPTFGFDTFILSDEPGCYDDAYTKWVESIDPSQTKKIRTSLPPEAFVYDKPSYSYTPRNTHEPFVFEGDEDLSHSTFVACETCEFINNHRDDRFFAIAGFYAPHAPVNPPKRFIEMYDNIDIPMPKVGPEDTYMPDVAGLSDDQWRKTVKYYYALVSHVDDCVGKIMDTLEETGLMDDTIIIFTTDHGEYLGDHGRIQKSMPHDCIINVPFIISYPNIIEEGLVIDELVEGVDFVPTILDYCSVQTPSFVQGKSIKGLLDGVKKSHRDDILVEHFMPGDDNSSIVRTKEYKYYCHSNGTEILFDLIEDPDEFHNVIDDKNYSSILSDMRLKMVKRLQQSKFKRTNRIAKY